ncbi:PSD1 and planctomycete cytochrome C domain-containing protein [Maribacter aestuarii]|uniref:PSD1 and planctomycete cytochrome C domain-containing protein n=1 Tax=Maribacter aestuarii TaxID=1130723 RepID=UPI0025A63E83|nr:PSD1 and planctomycete cytochrome C domain-containing protein [Maribacter aestuarii]
MGTFLKKYTTLTKALTCLLLSLFFGSYYSCQQNPSTSERVIAKADLQGIPEKIDFTFDVKPILSDRCFKCHGPDKNAIEAGLSLNKAEDAYIALGEHKDRFAIVPNQPDKSELVHRIYSEDPNLVMPPPESNLDLSPKEKAILEKWIAQGAEYKEHWAFIPPEKSKVPSVDGDDWGENEVDRFVMEKLQLNGLAPSPQASKEKLIRRVYLDLTGLPPTPAQVNSFVKNESPEAYENLIDSLLQTIDYAEHMAAEWMDIARYADTHGYQDDFERTMWPWRDWVIHAFDENMPYDEFVSVQLAGDLMPDANLEKILATGFNRNHKITFEGGTIPEEYHVEYVEDRLQTFGTAFLGLTLECARCHDHKYDPISQKEHFQLFSFFNNNKEKQTVPLPSETPEPFITITEKEANGVLSFINLQKSNKKEVPVMVMYEREEQKPAFILNRGVYDQPTDQVFPDTPRSVLTFPESYPKNRLGLSRWLFDADNPLTARVVVNRLWQRMFGTGLVSTSYDFGNQGALPSHPQLLDFLAIKFREEGWDTKRMLRYIALSATYKQTSVTTPELLEKDPANKWLARATRLRLTAEMIRDQALAISGLLSKEVGGPSVKPYQPEGIWEETTGGGGGSTARYVQSTGKDLYRKSLYTFWKRTVPPPSMMTFDTSSRDLCSVKRQETNTPLQALVLLNDPQIIEASRALATVTLNKYPKEVEKQISYVFQKATSRLPDTEELNMLREHYEDMKVKMDNGIIEASEYNSIGEFNAEMDVTEKELASLSLVVHTILNLDESITRG